MLFFGFHTPSCDSERAGAGIPARTGGLLRFTIDRFLRTLYDFFSVISMYPDRVQTRKMEYVIPLEVFGILVILKRKGHLEKPEDESFHFTGPTPLQGEYGEISRDSFETTWK
jgi:hypothetical protein